MLLQQFQQHIKEQFPHLSPANNKLLLAVSGGIDSMVLTDLFYKAGYDFEIAHCNFQLRGEESERDELFVRSLEKNYGNQILVKRFETNEYANQNKISIQEAARKLRYDWFEEINSQWSIMNEDAKDLIDRSPFTIHYIATAHNADDNIETLLMYLFRGTGISGLTGIKAFDKERKILRPLLFATRKQIEIYATDNKLQWVEDSSNLKDNYTRNFFRHKIIPLAEEQFANAKKNLADNIERFKEAELLYRQSIKVHKKKLLEDKGNEIHIPILKLQQTKPLDTVIWEIIRPYNFHAQQVNEIKKLFAAENSSYVKSSTHRIIKNRNWLVIAPLNNEAANYILIKKNDTQINFQNGLLEFEHISALNFKLQTLNHIALLDAKNIDYPLLLRKWKQGDYFYPLGMQKKKKLSRFFIDLKLSATTKENVWIVEMNKKIVWVVGYRIDDRFKITSSTKEVLKIGFTAAPEN